jgi:hypothetical protein
MVAQSAGNLAIPVNGHPIASAVGGITGPARAYAYPARRPRQCRVVPARGDGSVGTATTAQTVSPVSSVLTPQLLARYSTMPRPRPPRDETVACAVIGLVDAPPSLTATSTALSSSVQARSNLEPGRGLACRMALLSSSLTTRTASPTTPSNTPAAVSSAASRRRATATLAGAHGRSTVPAILTSLRRTRQSATRAAARSPLPRKCPALAG